MEMRTPILNRMPGYWEGAPQPEQRLIGWLLTWGGGPTGILWVPST